MNRGKSGVWSLKSGVKIVCRVLLCGLCMAIFSAGEATDQKTRRAEVVSNPGGWREAAAGYEFSFPRDHASHPEYKIEWWYYTGNLETGDGKRIGYQLTFFRTGVIARPLVESRWAVRDLYITHFAIADIDEKKFHWFERINRAGIGWAGADEKVYRVWNEDWQARMDGADHLIEATEGDFRLELRLSPEKKEIVHGEEGVSRKGPAAENASHYYSVTRFRTRGRVMIAGRAFDVTGASWMDHEFGTSILGTEQKGWDWFSIQLEDGRELMLFRTRQADGSIDPRSNGTLIEKDGSATRLAFDEFQLTPVSTWQSERSGARYPTEWKLDLPRFDLSLRIRAAFNDQELTATESAGVVYWEGSVTVEGNGARGSGYLEMTGYTGQSMGAVMR
ncbi:MAG: lipocalin-like domain-containing protein [Acidobacteriota bacterium]